MKRLSLALLVLAAFVGTSFAASVFQLDVCNKHRTVSEAPGTSLTITQVWQPVVVLASAGSITNCTGACAALSSPVPDKCPAPVNAPSLRSCMLLCKGLQRAGWLVHMHTTPCHTAPPCCRSHIP